MKTIRLKRLWNNLASLRDYIVKDAIKKGDTLKIVVDNRDDFMILTPDELKRKSFEVLGKDFQSKFTSSMNYKLIDFAWKPEAKLNKDQGVLL